MGETRRILLAGAVGNVIEWYDFSLYGYFAIYLAHSFFPANNETTAMLATFAAFASGFLARPIGALWLGQLGDKIGRRKTLLLSVALVAIPTILIGILPTYHQVGMLAPILLIVMRVLQGISVGGEYSGSITFIAEYAEPKRRGLFANTVWVSAVVGFLLGSLVSWLILHFGSALKGTTWIWRIPFLLSSVIALGAFWLRRNLHETPQFEHLQEAAEVARSPLAELFSKHRKGLVQAFCLAIPSAIGYYTLYTYSINYLIKLNHPEDTVILMNSASLILGCLLSPIAAHLSDKVGRKPVMFISSIGISVLAVPMFYFMQRAQIWISMLSLATIVVAVVSYIGPSIALYAELFDNRVRYVGTSVAYNFSFGIFGGTVPFIQTWLFHNVSHSGPGYYLALSGVVGIIAVLCVPELAGRRFDD